jgi:uncharacterized RDD family membrane protein YckC
MTDAQNPYKSPQAELTHEATGLPLAARGSRFGAALIDGLILLCVTIPISYLLGVYDGLMEGVQPGFGQQALGSLVGIVVFLAINGHFLKNYGQTVGKRVLKLAIVDLQGNKPEWITMYLKRYLLWGLVAYIPIIGGLILLANYLFIFRADRRCLHDLTASTRVVQLPN